MSEVDGARRARERGDGRTWRERALDAEEVARVEYARAEKLHDALRPFLRGSGPGRSHGTFTFGAGQHVVWITQAEWLAAKDAVGL